MIYVLVQGDVRVIRTCAVKENPKKEDTKNNCYWTVMEGFDSYVCNCNDKDFCNGASLTQASTLLFAVLSVVLMGLLC